MLTALLPLLACMMSTGSVKANLDWASSSLYILGCSKNAAPDQVPKLASNIQVLLSTLSNPLKQGTVIIYGDGASRQQFLKSNHSAYVFLDDQYNHHSRTMRIANCRNQLLSKVGEMVTSRKEEISRVFFIMLDLDGVNCREYNMAVFREVTKNYHEWASVSFNRPNYYDIWALRTDRFNMNIFNAKTPIPALHISKDDIDQELANTVNPYYPVISAFNGIAIYRYNYTIGCQYDGLDRKSHYLTAEDCEHVAFHKCITTKNNGKVVIYKHSLNKLSEAAKRSHHHRANITRA